MPGCLHEVPRGDPPPVERAEVAAPPAPSAPEFHLAAYRDGALEFAQLGDSLFLAGEGALVRIDAAGELAPVAQPVPPELLPSAGPRAARYWTRFAYGGLWPDRAFLLAEARDLRISAPPQLFRRASGLWRRLDTGEDRRRRYLAIFTWHEGQVLGLRLGQPDLLQLEREAMSGGTSAPLVAAQGFDLLGERIAPAWPTIATELFLTTAAAAPDGRLFLLAHRGDPELGRIAVQRWDPAHPERPGGVVDDLPGRATAEHLVVGAADRVYVAGARRDRDAAYLARFDGATWSEEPVPTGIRFRDLALAGDGDLWAVTDLAPGDPWREAPTALSLRRAGGAWERVRVPDVDLPSALVWDYGPDWKPRRCGLERAGRWPARIHHVAAHGADVWLIGAIDLALCGVAGRDVVLRTRPLRAAPHVVPGERRLITAQLDDLPAVAFRGACSRGGPPLAVFMNMSEETPDDTRVPALEDFVRANPELMADVRGIFEFDRAGARLIGMFVSPAISPARQKALLAALDRAVPDEPHALTCRWPPVRRAFSTITGDPEARP